MDTFFVIHFLDEVKIGMQDASIPKRHVTFLAHANSSDPKMKFKFAEEVERVAEATLCFTLQLGGTEMFGPNQDMPVTTVIGDEFSQKLHDQLLLSSQNLGLQLGQPQYTGVNFRPHVSLDTVNPRPDDRNFVQTLTLVRHIGGYGSGQVEVVSNSFLSVDW